MPPLLCFFCHPEERRTTQETPQSSSAKKITQSFVILRNEGPHKKLHKLARQSKIKQSLAQWQLDKEKAHKINNKTLWSYVVELLVWSFVPQDDKAVRALLCRSAMITNCGVSAIYFFVDFSSLTSFISVAIFSFFSSMSSSLASASSL